MMKPIMTYDIFSTVAVPFPFTDKMKTKHRPALVLSNKKHQNETNHITLLMITSAKHSSWKSDYRIKDIQSTGLTAPSIVRQKIFTIDIRLITDHLGVLSNQDIKQVKKHLNSHLGTIKC